MVYKKRILMQHSKYGSLIFCNLAYALLYLSNIEGSLQHQ